MLPPGPSGSLQMFAGPARRVLVLAAGVMLWGAWPAVAHDQFAECVQQQFTLSLRPEHIDLTVELTFFELASSAERRKMDRAGDGRIQREEVASYCRELNEGLRGQVVLRYGDGVLELIALADPEIDLLGDAGVHWAHHGLSLRFFAVRPRALRVGDSLTVESRLWPEWPAPVVLAGRGLRSDSESLEFLGTPDPARLTALPEGVWRKVRFVLGSVTSSPEANASSEGGGSARPRNPEP